MYDKNTTKLRDLLTPVLDALDAKQPFEAQELLEKLEKEFSACCKECCRRTSLLISREIVDCHRRIDNLIEALPLLEERPDDGYHFIADGELPEPNVLLHIRVAENSDSVGGGVAALGSDGNWYWTHDRKLKNRCKYTVVKWCYL